MKHVFFLLMATAITVAGCATSKSAETSGSGNATVNAEKVQEKAPGKPINTKTPASSGANAVNNYPTATE